MTLFEAHEELGGMMRYGIPGYRTPREMLDDEIDRIIDLGVEVHTKHPHRHRRVAWKSSTSAFDAVFWALGAQQGRPLPIPGWDGADNCINGIEFLDAFNEGWVVGTRQEGRRGRRWRHLDRRRLGGAPPGPHHRGARLRAPRRHRDRLGRA